MNTIIITAGGIGKRMNSDLPKQFLTLCGLPILMRTIQRFADFDASLQIILTLPNDYIEEWKKLCEHFNFNIEHQIIAGGKERYDSIKNALKISKGNLIGVHDGVRPLVSLATITNAYNAAENFGSGIPIIRITESLRQIKETKNKAVNRSEYVLVQTPQCFKNDIIQKAYAGVIPENTTDDASLVELSGSKINLVDGNEENIKITTPKDLKIAEILFSEIN